MKRPRVVIESVCVCGPGPCRPECVQCSSGRCAVSSRGPEELERQQRLMFSWWVRAWRWTCELLAAYFELKAVQHSREDLVERFPFLDDRRHPRDRGDD